MSEQTNPGNTPEILCPHCGTRNPQGAFFCNRCGTALTGEGERPADPAAPLVPGSDDLDADVQPAAPRLHSSDEDDFLFIDDESADEGSIEPYDEGFELRGGAESARPGRRDFEPTIEEILAHFPEREFEAETEETPATPVAEELPPDFLRFPDEQLLGSMQSGGTQPGQSYLESVTISGDMAAPAARVNRGALGDADHWRAVRALVREEPVLATASGQPGVAPVQWRKSWLFLLVLAAALLPFVLQGQPTIGAPQMWTGVGDAYATIENLTLNSEVLVFWQVDPSTAGELNQASMPVVSHLLERGARSVVVTLQPAGLATARRLYADAVAGLDASAMITIMQGWVGDGVYLTGGTSALPLIAQDANHLIDPLLNRTVAPALAVVIAPRADDVQQWLEIVQPVNRLPVVAVTSAGADPMLRPYRDSGQLSGLVSGFDGAASYQSLRSDSLPDRDMFRIARTIDAQNWGAVVMFILMITAVVVSIAQGSRNSAGRDGGRGGGSHG